MNLFVNTVYEHNSIIFWVTNEFHILGLYTPTLLGMFSNHVWYFSGLSGTCDHVKSKSII